MLLACSPRLRLSGLSCTTQNRLPREWCRQEVDFFRISYNQEDHSQTCPQGSLMRATPQCRRSSQRALACVKLTTEVKADRRSSKERKAENEAPRTAGAPMRSSGKLSKMSTDTQLRNNFTWGWVIPTPNTSRFLNYGCILPTDGSLILNQSPCSNSREVPL